MMSPRPNALGILGAGEGWLISGMIVRVNQVPVLIQTDRNYRLNVQDPLCGVVGADAKIEVILERHADEVSDRVLGFLSQFLGAFGLWVTGRLGRVSGVHCNAY